MKKYTKTEETFIIKFSKECMIGNQNTFAANILSLKFSSKYFAHSTNFIKKLLG